MKKRQQGDIAENIAQSWLEAKGFSVLERNYLRRVGEIDLILLHPNEQTIVFVEVRFRASGSFGGALASVDFKKQRKLIKAANSWLQRNADSMTPARIDVIAICPASNSTAAEKRWEQHEIDWIQNAIEE